MKSADFRARLTSRIRFRMMGVYCIGTTGTGKSKFIEGLSVADVRAGRGCGLVDPHGDLAHDVLANLLSGRYFDRNRNHNLNDSFDRVIYFGPARTDYTVEFNVLRSRLPPVLQ